MAERVRISEVSPRDGLQNEPRRVGVADKARLIEALCTTGVDEIEVSSFVSPKWIPQLGDAAELFALVAARKPETMLYSALVPNEIGMERLLQVNSAHPGRLIDKASVFTSASETFSQKNTNASIAQTLDRFRPVLALARQNGLLTRGYISCVVECPFEGAIAPQAVARVASDLLELGLDEIDLGDTIGRGTPDTIAQMLKTVMDAVPPEQIVLHLHDTFGQAAECVESALEMGIRAFDASVAGLGGCPYASTPTNRAPGNIDTCRLVETVLARGYACRVQRDALLGAAKVARSIISSPGEHA